MLPYDPNTPFHRSPGAPGINLRCWLAGQALAGTAAALLYHNGPITDTTAADVAALAVAMADEVLAELAADGGAPPSQVNGKGVDLGRLAAGEVTEGEPD